MRKARKRKSTVQQIERTKQRYRTKMVVCSGKWKSAVIFRPKPRKASFKRSMLISTSKPSKKWQMPSSRTSFRRSPRIYLSYEALLQRQDLLICSRLLNSNPTWWQRLKYFSQLRHQLRWTLPEVLSCPRLLTGWISNLPWTPRQIHSKRLIRSLLRLLCLFKSHRCPSHQQEPTKHLHSQFKATILLKWQTQWSKWVRKLNQILLRQFN